MAFLEIFRMAISAITSHKLRSSLTLVGIIAGVASIIGVMTGISVIQNTIESELSVLGSTVFQVQKWPVGGFGSEEERRKAMRRPPVTVEQANAIREEVETVDIVGSELWDFGMVVEYRGESTNPNVTLCGGTPEYPPNNTHYVGLGRNISQWDVKTARSVAVIGHAIAEKLFPFVDPIGKEVRLDGRKFEVIGVSRSAREIPACHEVIVNPQRSVEDARSLLDLDPQLLFLNAGQIEREVGDQEARIRDVKAGSELLHNLI